MFDRNVGSRAGFWTAVVAGALVAAALSSILLSFALGVGLSVASTSPTWRDTSVALVLLSGFYLILQAVVSFAAGGYVAGRFGFSDAVLAGSPEVIPATVTSEPTAQAGVYRSAVSAPLSEYNQRDGFLGLLSWALAVLLGAFLLAAVAAFGSAARPAATSPTVSTAEPLLSYEIDELYRSPRRPANADISAPRAEAGRILLKTAGHDGVSPNDRAYLIADVAAVTGLSPADSEHRVDQILGEARQTVRRSRHTGVILAFSSAAALLLGAIMAWLGGICGARHRDGEVPHWLR